MCGRYTLTASNKPDLAHLNLDIPDRYNIPAGVSGGGRSSGIHLMSWSFSPAWAKTPMNLFNARAETLTESHHLKTPSAAYLSPTAGMSGSGQRLLAGLGITTLMANFSVLRVFMNHGGCAIVTMGAQAGIAHIHHRQPLLLSADASDQWLNGAPAGDCMTDITVDCHRVVRR